MPTNPFIALAQDPIAVFAWLGYLLLMLAILITAIPWAIRKTAWLYARYLQNRHRDDWWSFGTNPNGYIPPAGWLAQAFLVLLVLAVAAWACGALIWLVGL